jgi:hypothetical protein
MLSIFYRTHLDHLLSLQVRCSFLCHFLILNRLFHLKRYLMFHLLVFLIVLFFHELFLLALSFYLAIITLNEKILNAVFCHLCFLFERSFTAILLIKVLFLKNVLKILKILSTLCLNFIFL